jgi:integrase
MPMQVQGNLPGLISATLSKLERSGYSPSTIQNFKWTCGALRKFCEDDHIENYEETVGERFLDSYEMREGRAVNKNHRRYIQQLNYTLTNIEWQPFKNGRPPAKYASSCFDELVEAYEAYLYKSGKTRVDVRGRVHIVSRFLQFAERRGRTSLGDLAVADIYAAFESSTDKNRFRRLVGAFLRYAHKYNLTKTSLYLFMPSVVRHQAVPSVYSPEEVEQLLASIDRSTNIGKRDYAMVLMAARLGMRASDIAGLTFNTFRETNPTVKIVQAKTKRPVTLPLLDEVKLALSEYIDVARPASNDDHIFLNVRGFNAITPSNIGQAVKRAIVGSGIDCGNRRRGSHSLRASLATALLEEGNDYATIQQVLGQSDIQSTKSYTKASIEKLRTNALPVPLPSGNFRKLLSVGGNSK